MPFTTIDYYGKEYCSLRCRNREKRHRHKARDLNLTMKVDNPYFIEIPNPTIEQLDVYAQMVLKEQTDDKPVRCYGTIPMWVPPHGLIWKQSEGVKPTEWLMFHPAMTGETEEVPDVVKQLLRQ